jgi:hypothetical protein
VEEGEEGKVSSCIVLCQSGESGIRDRVVALAKSTAAPEDNEVMDAR